MIKKEENYQLQFKLDQIRNFDYYLFIFILLLEFCTVLILTVRYIDCVRFNCVVKSYIMNKYIREVNHISIV